MLPSDAAIEAIIHQATRDSRPPQPDTRTQLFVGNLPYRVRWQDLKDLFRQAGTVLRADVSLGPDNRSRGYGTVLLASAEDAARAVQLFNGYNWQTRILEVRPDRLVPDQDAHLVQDYEHPLPLSLPPGYDLAACRTLFVGNLPFHCQWQDLKDLFRQAGTILRADVALGPDGRSRGFGSVVFATEHDAERAVRMLNGYEYSGRTLKVHFDKFSSTPHSPAPLHSLPVTSSSARDPLSVPFALDYTPSPHPPSPREIFSRLQQQQQRSTTIYHPAPHSQARQAHHPLPHHTYPSSRASTAQSSSPLDVDSLSTSLASTRLLSSSNIQSSTSGGSSSTATTTSSSSERSYSSTSASSVSQPLSSHSRTGGLFSQQQQRHEPTHSTSSTTSSTSLHQQGQQQHPGPIALPPPPQLAFHQHAHHHYSFSQQQAHQHSIHSALSISPLHHPSIPSSTTVPQGTSTNLTHASTRGGLSSSASAESPYHGFSAATPMVAHPRHHPHHPQQQPFVVTPQGVVPFGPAPITPSMPPFTFVGPPVNVEAQRASTTSRRSSNASGSGSGAVGSSRKNDPLGALVHQQQQHQRSASRSTTGSRSSASGSLRDVGGSSGSGGSRAGSSVSQRGKGSPVVRSGSSAAGTTVAMSTGSGSTVGAATAPTTSATTAGRAGGSQPASASRPMFANPLPSPSFVFPTADGGALVFNPSPLHFPPPHGHPYPLPPPIPLPATHVYAQHPHHPHSQPPTPLHLVAAPTAGSPLSHPHAHPLAPHPHPLVPHPFSPSRVVHYHSVQTPFSPAGMAMMSPGTFFGRAGENLNVAQNPMMNPAVGAPPIRSGGGGQGQGQYPVYVQQQQQQTQQQVQEPQGYFDPAYFPAHVSAGGDEHVGEKHEQGLEDDHQDDQHYDASGNGGVHEQGDEGEGDEGLVLSPTSATPFVSMFPSLPGGGTSSTGPTRSQTRHQPAPSDDDTMHPGPDPDEIYESSITPTTTTTTTNTNTATKTTSLPIHGYGFQYGPYGGTSSGNPANTPMPRRKTTMTTTSTSVTSTSTGPSSSSASAPTSGPSSGSSSMMGGGGLSSSAPVTSSGHGPMSLSASSSSAAMATRKWKSPSEVVEAAMAKARQQQQHQHQQYHQHYQHQQKEAEE